MELLIEAIKAFWLPLIQGVCLVVIISLLSRVVANWFCKE
jgi:hypothetical protein